MALRLVESFDGVSTIAQLVNNQVSANKSSSGKWVNRASTVSGLELAFAPGRTGMALKSTAQSSNPGIISNQILGALTITVGLAWNPASTSTSGGTRVIFCASNDDPLNSLRATFEVLQVDQTLRFRTFNSSGSTTDRVTTGNIITSANVWHYIEVQAGWGSSVSWAFKVDGTLQGSGSGADIRGATVNGAVQYSGIALFDDASNSHNNGDLIDDFYVEDNTGTYNTDFLGAVRIRAIRPDGNGTTSGMVNSSGNSINNYKYVADDRIDNGVGLVLESGWGDAWTPTSSSLQITGDIDLRVACAADNWVPAGQQALIAKWESGQQAYVFSLASTGKLKFDYSTTGSNDFNGSSSVAPTVTNGSTLAVRVTFGTATGVLTFYTKSTTPTTALTDITSNSGWTQLGTTVSITANPFFNGTSTLRIGSLDGTTQYFAGTIHAAVVMSGISGTVVANPDFANQAAGTSQFQGGAGNVWTIQPGRLDSTFVQSTNDGDKDTYLCGPMPSLAGSIVGVQVVLQDQQISGSTKQLHAISRNGTIEQPVRVTNLNGNLRESWAIVQSRPLSGLYLPDGNSTISTPDNAAFHINNPDFRIAFAPAVSAPTTQDWWLVAKWTVGNDYIFYLQSANGQPTLSATNIGTAAAGSVLPIKNGDLIAARAIHVQSTGNDTFYYKLTTVATALADCNSDSGWVTLSSGSAGSSNLTNSSSPLQIGGSLVGVVYAMVLKDAPGGTPGSALANPDFTAQADNTTSFTDAAGRTWTTSGNATIRSVTTSPAWTLTDINAAQFGMVQRSV